MRGHGVADHDGGLLIRVGAGPIVAGVAAFATGFIFCLWLTTERAPANAGLRADARFTSAFDAVEAKPLARGAGTLGTDVGSFGARWASLGAEGASKFTFDDDRTELRSASSSFGERFAFEQGDASSGALQLAASFDDRFASEPGATARSPADPSKTDLSALRLRRRSRGQLQVLSSRRCRRSGRRTPGSSSRVRPPRLFPSHTRRLIR